MILKILKYFSLCIYTVCVISCTTTKHRTVDIQRPSTNNTSVIRLQPGTGFDIIKPTIIKPTIIKPNIVK
jgi:hypothetical protein